MIMTVTRKQIEDFILDHIHKHRQFTDADRGRWLAAAKRLVIAYPSLELTYRGDSEYVTGRRGKRTYYPSHWTLRPKE